MTSVSVSRGFVAAVALALCASWPPLARADSSPIPDTGSPPWADPSHQSPLEVLAARIASQIAGRQVTVRCETQSDWEALAAQRGEAASSLAGFVGSTWPTLDGVPSGAPQIAAVAQLSPSTCLHLQQFAVANPKPTECKTTRTRSSTSYKTVRVRTRVRVVVNGKVTFRVVVRTKKVPVTTAISVPGPLVPCATLAASKVPSDYGEYAFAIFTLAHESIHLGGAVYGVVNGYAVGDPEAEAKASCSGMQSMLSVATQLGDNPEDAQAIATWMARVKYPAYENSDAPQYWSVDCVAGGRLDVRADKAGAWPVGGTQITVPTKPFAPASNLSIGECWVTDQDSWASASKISRTLDPSPSLSFVTTLKQAPSSNLAATGTVTAPSGSVVYSTTWTWTPQHDQWRVRVQASNAATGLYQFQIALSDGSRCHYAVAFER